jgi:hypothetical protein
MHLKILLLVSLAGAEEINVDTAHSCKELVDQWDMKSMKKSQDGIDQASTAVGLAVYNYFRDNLPEKNKCMYRWCILTMPYAKELIGRPDVITKLRGQKDDPSTLALKGALSEALKYFRPNSCPDDTVYKRVKGDLESVKLNS